MRYHYLHQDRRHLTLISKQHYIKLTGNG
jgi:hypothetical protein